MNDKAVFKIQKYIDECLFEPSINWFKYEFKKRSYARWAAFEILDRIIEEEMKLPAFISGQERLTPVEIIWQYVEVFDSYSDLTEDKDVQFIFSTARDTAENLIYLFS